MRINRINLQRETFNLPDSLAVGLYPANITYKFKNGMEKTAKKDVVINAESQSSHLWKELAIELLYIVLGFTRVAGIEYGLSKGICGFKGTYETGFVENIVDDKTVSVLIHYGDNEDERRTKLWTIPKLSTLADCDPRFRESINKECINLSDELKDYGWNKDFDKYF